jgi:hypothetical protein
MRLVSILSALLLVACASTEEETDGFEDLEGPDAGKGDDATSWTSVGFGVAYQQVNSGPGVVIAYGGYSAKLSYSAAWALELVDAKLGGADVGHVYAVKGPQDAGYGAREIGNSKLRAHLRALPGDAPIYMVAHSSGSFVAHELLGQLYNGDDDAILSRIAYANLDGGGSGLDRNIASALGTLSFVYAQDPTLGSGLSQNSSSAIALGAAYAMHGSAQKVVVANTGCASGAGWCLHDVVITHRPHNRFSYDLARDYTDFVNRPVTTEYLDALIPTPDE